MNDLTNYEDFLTSNGDWIDLDYEPEPTPEEEQEREIRRARRLDEIEIRF